jgi:adenine deaminase
MFDLSGKTALVTGAATGIGAAIAVGLAQAGAEVIVTDKPGEDLSPTAAAVQKAGHRCESIALDVRELAHFDIAAPSGANRVRARVIGVVENQAPTRALEAELPVADGLVAGEGGVCQIALVERHRGTGAVVNAFVAGFGYDLPCAVASTVAHDSHHMIVVGTSKPDMAQAANRLAELGGGVTVWREGRELAHVALPIAGLMSDAPAAEVAAAAQGIVAAMRACGCTLNNAYMQHSLLALVVIPELRISDQGLIDVTRFARTDLFLPG